MADNLSADVVVIGSGIIGALTARKLALHGASVIILEAGPRVTRDQLVANFRNSPRRSDWMSPYPFSPWAPHPVYLPEDNGYLVQAGPYPYPAEYIRVVGGTTWHWAAHAWRNVPNDFKIHSLYGVGVDWPFGYDDLEPYTRRPRRSWACPAPTTPARRAASRFRWSRWPSPGPCAASANGWRASIPSSATPPPGTAAATAAGRPVSATTAASPSVRSMRNIPAESPWPRQRPPGCACFPMPTSTSSSTARTAASWRHCITIPTRTPIGSRARPSSSRPMASRAPGCSCCRPATSFPMALANDRDMVGRHLMDHPSTSLSFDADEELWLGRGPQSPSSINTMRDGDFRAEHAPYRLDFTNISRVDGATRTLIAQGIYGPELEKRLRYSAARELNVKNVLEVLPRPEHRVTLANQKDAMGLPKAQGHYSIDEYTRKGHERSKTDFRRIAELMGGTNLRFSKEGDFANNQHICGTLSMGTDPSVSVCNQWGQAHDHENLFLAGTGVLPTSSTCNSTENGLAVALRMAQYILSEQAGVPMPASSAVAQS